MRLRNFLRRPPEEQRLLFTALYWVACIRAGLWLLPFRILRPVVEHAGRNPGPEVTDELVAARIAWAISSAARFVPRATCVTQALAARILLARRGLASEVCYGVGRLRGQIIAHAWLESGGRVIVGGGSSESLLPLAPLERRMRERRMRAETCCGPGHFSSSTSPLRLGNAEQEPLEDILARGCADPILEAISLIGPHGLYTLLQRDTEAARRFQPRRMYSGICELCLDINNSPPLVAALRRRLEEPDAQIMLAAARMWAKRAPRERPGRVPPPAAKEEDVLSDAG